MVSNKGVTREIRTVSLKVWTLKSITNSDGNLLEMEILCPSPDLLNQKVEGVGGLNVYSHTLQEILIDPKI